jgi:SAM-dependent methyltransferase
MIYFTKISFFVKSFLNGWFGLRPKRQYSNKDRYHTYQKNLIKLCPDKGIIVDIGSGGHPFPKATILADRFLEITNHRHDKLVRDEREFIILDIEHLPFKDKSIDYVYCSHLLEHVNSPEDACNEIIRVGKAGYIETPNIMKDMLFSWARGMHKWHTLTINNKLLFFEYNERQLEGVRSTYWRDTVLGKYYHPNQDLYYPNEDMFNTMFEWEESFEVFVYRL